MRGIAEIWGTLSHVEEFESLKALWMKKSNEPNLKV